MSRPLGARGPAYITPPNEYGPSDQTDLIHTVFLNPLDRGSIIRETEPDWLRASGGRPRGEGRRPAPRPARPPARSCGFWTLLDVG